MSDSPVTMSLVGSVALVSLDDGKVNALNAGLLNDLWSTLASAEEQARAIVITGRPGVFSAGLDLRVVQTGGRACSDLVHHATELFLRLAEFPRPVVIACTGHALAAGAVLLLCSDVRIGTAGNYKIGLTEVSVGIALPELVVELARRRLARRHLTVACNTAQVYSPAAAVEVGFLDRLSPADATAEALSVAAELAERLQPAAFVETRKATCCGLTETIMRTAAALLKTQRTPPTAANPPRVVADPTPRR